MENITRSRYWSMFQEIKYKSFYYAFYKHNCDRKIRWMKIFLSLSTCGSVAGWAIWDCLPTLWAFIIALAQIVSVLQEHLPFAKESEGIEYLLPELEQILVHISSDWNKIDCMTESEAIDKIECYQLQVCNLESKYLASSAFLYDEDATKRAEEESKKFFNYYLLESKEGISL